MRKSLILFLLCLVAACSYPDELTSLQEVQTMTLSLSPIDVASTDTRSILTATNIEDRINHATVAVYDAETGLLVDAVHTYSSLSLNLATGHTYNIYAAANMGDLTPVFPEAESDVEDIRFTLPPFSSLNLQGMPMAGKITTSWESNITIPVRRLLAKVIITVDHSGMNAGGADKSFKGVTVKVHRAAQAVYPFAEGGSRALSSSDLYSGVADHHTSISEYANASEELTLYIPENMQGTLLNGNDSQWDKSESNSSLDASLCTYITLEGVKDGSVDGVEGDFTYRFFPGEDATENFDLEGNTLYRISMKLTWNGMYVTDNWKVEKTGWSDTRMIRVSTAKDGGYASGTGIVLAQGSDRVPVYIFYSPHGNAYESEDDGGEAQHLSKGWVFMPSKSPSDGFAVTTSRANNSEYVGTYMSTGFVEHDSYRTTHYVTIPRSTAVGYTNSIMYRTSDWRKNAYLNISVVAPAITLSPTSMVFGHSEYGYSSRRTVKVLPSSPVKPCNISSVTVDSSNVTLGSYDSDTGEVEVYWKTANTSSTARTAKVTFTSSCCGTSASCTLTQQARGGLVIGGDDEGGDADIEY